MLSNRPLERQPRQKLSILIPVFNERWTLATIVRRALAVPLDLDRELIVVDDGSSDGSWEELQRLAADEPLIRALRHPRNQGKGAAIRTAIDHMTGDIAVVQDADLEYDPNDYRQMLVPILDGRADAVFGSRFEGHPRRVLYFWHEVANRILTLLSNMANDINLTDMETCYKMVRTDVLKQLRLQSSTFTLEPEITCRLAQWGARIYEVPISYSGRTYDEGKKIRAIDGVKALWETFRCRFLDRRFTNHNGFYAMKSMASARRYNRWLIDLCRPHMGSRILEAGTGIGNFTNMFVNCERLVLLDREAVYVKHLQCRLGRREHIRFVQADLTDACVYPSLKEERLDTVLCINVLEHIENDGEVLRQFHDLLVPGGRCIMVVPAGKSLYCGLDRELGHYRRYSDAELREKMQNAGFDIVSSQRIARGAALVWWFYGCVLRGRHIGSRLTSCSDLMFAMLRRLDFLVPVPGISLVMVGARK